VLPSGKSQISPADVFELAGHAAFDGPMPGIVDSRGHFVGNQASLDDEEFHREDADVGEGVQHRASNRCGPLAIEARVRIRRNAVVQNPAAVSIGRERIEHGAAAAERAPTMDTSRENG